MAEVSAHWMQQPAVAQLVSELFAPEALDEPAHPELDEFFRDRV